MINVITVPSHLTNSAHRQDQLESLKRHGIEGIWYQVQNGGNTPVDYDLDIARNAKLFAGVWGVTYAPDDPWNNPNKLTFFEQNKILGTQAIKLNADTVMVDAEECLKNTRDSRGGREIIDGIRAGGWLGPVHLTTMGAPLHPLVDDYEFDLLSFLETRGGIFGQAYAQILSSYGPRLTKMYYCEQMKVPLDQYNTMIWIDYRLTPQAQVQLLRDAATGRAVSIFMTEYGSELDWGILDAITNSSAPSPVDSRLTLDPTLIEFRDKAIVDLGKATSKNPQAWADANPREWQMLQNYLLYRVAFNMVPPVVAGYTRSYDPPTNCGTQIGKGMADLLMAAASLLGR